MPRKVKEAGVTEKKKPAKGGVATEKKKKKKSVEEKMKKLREQVRQSQTLVLGRMFYSLFQELEDQEVKNTRRCVSEFSSLLSRNCLEGMCGDKPLHFEKIASAVVESWTAFKHGDGALACQIFGDIMTTPPLPWEHTKVEEQDDEDGEPMKPRDEEEDKAFMMYVLPDQSQQLVDELDIPLPDILLGEDNVTSFQPPCLSSTLTPTV